MMKFEVRTQIIDDIICQETNLKTEDVVYYTVRNLIDLQDEQIRKILIEKGWTPPKED